MSWSGFFPSSSSKTPGSTAPIDLPDNPNENGHTEFSNIDLTILQRKTPTSAVGQASTQPSTSAAQLGSSKSKRNEKKERKHPPRWHYKKPTTHKGQIRELYGEKLKVRKRSSNLKVKHKPGCIYLIVCSAKNRSCVEGNRVLSATNRTFDSTPPVLATLP